MRRFRPRGVADDCCCSSTADKIKWIMERVGSMVTAVKVNGREFPPDGTGKVQIDLKSIGGQSIVGSGDIPVAAAAEWGNITGTLADQTDLKDALDAKADTADLATVATTGDYDDLIDKPDLSAYVTDSELATALSAKQDTLVSGTNIKTVNGAPVLGSGDLEVGSVEVWRISSLAISNPALSRDGVYKSPQQFAKYVYDNYEDKEILIQYSEHTDPEDTDVYIFRLDYARRIEEDGEYYYRVRYVQAADNWPSYYITLDMASTIGYYTVPRITNNTTYYTITYDI